MTVEQCQREMRSREFLRWRAYLKKKKTEERERWEFYAAMIAAEIRRTISKDPKKPKIKDFLLRFGIGESKQKTNMTKEEAAAHAKAAWAGRLGIPMRKFLTMVKKPWTD